MLSKIEGRAGLSDICAFFLACAHANVSLGRKVYTKNRTSSQGKTMGLARDILKHINDYPRQNTDMLHQTLEYSLSGIKNALVNLTDLGLIETQPLDIYKITDLGKHVLDNIPLKKPRTCPICNQQFKSMTDAQWKINLIQHLKSSMKHYLDPEEAKKFVDEVSDL